MKDIFEQKAGELLKQCGTVALASINENGYPRICIMATLAGAEGIRRLYFMTGANSKKVGHFLANPKASVCYFNGNDSVTLTGSIKVSQDIELKKKLWQNDMIEYYTGGVSDPSYCILEFSANEAIISIDNQYETFPI
jgi:general stress protein 26